MTPDVDLSSELAEARRRLDELESLVEISPVAIVVMDADERVTGWNPAAAQLFGYSPQEAIGRLIDDLVLNEDLRGEGRDVTHEALERGRADRITRRVRKDGKLVDVQMMLVPLRVDGEHVGFYAIYHDITELQRAREHAETLLAVTQVLGKTLSLEDTFETILRELQEVVPYDSCSIQVIQGNRLVIVGARGLEDLGGLIGVGFDLDDETNPGSQGRAVEAATGLRATCRSTRISRVQRHGGGRIRGWICAPMIIGDRVIGVLSVDKFEPDFYTEELAQLATAFAAQAAIAIENARLLETERAAREQAETLRAAADVAREHAGRVRGLRPDPVGAAQGRSLSKCQHPAARRRRVRDRRRPRLSGHRRAARASLRLEGPDDPAWGLVERHETIIVSNASERYPQFEDVHVEGSIKTWMAVPLLIGDRLIGMLTLDSFEVDFYTAEHADVARGLRRVRRDGDRQGAVRQPSSSGRARRRRRRRRQRAPSSPP